MTGPVLAATAWPTNGHLIAACHLLGYLLDTDHVLDPTYERGIWWQQWRPEKLTTHHRAVDGSDFRSLPYPDGSFDAVAFDPPYVCPGGRKTSTVKEMHDRFGMQEGGAEDPMFSTPAELQQIINDGLTEMVRLVRPRASKHRGGIVLVKCQNYIWSGEFWPGAELVRDHAMSLGCDVVDRLEYLTSPGPQPSTTKCGQCKGSGLVGPLTDPLCPRCEGLGALARRIVHARRNLSTLWVFRAPKASATQGALL